MAKFVVISEYQDPPSRPSYIVRTCFYDVLTFQWIFSYGIRLHPMAQEVLQEWYDILGMLQKISDTGDERLQRSYWFKATYYRFG